MALVVGAVVVGVVGGRLLLRPLPHRHLRPRRVRLRLALLLASAGTWPLAAGIAANVAAAVIDGDAPAPEARLGVLGDVLPGDRSIGDVLGVLGTGTVAADLVRRRRPGPGTVVIDLRDFVRSDEEVAAMLRHPTARPHPVPA